MTLNEIISILAERSNRTFDTAYINQLKEIVIAQRYKFLRDTLNKNPRERRTFLQSIELPIKKTDEISLIGCPPDVKVSVTSEKVPNHIRANSMMFEYVGGKKMNSPYTYIDPSRIGYLYKGKYHNKRSKYYTYINEKIYTFNSAGSVITVNTVFSDPRQLKTYGYNEDVEFVAPFDLVNLIINNVLRTELNVQIPENANKEIELNP